MGFKSQKNVLFKSEEILYDLIVHLLNNRFAYSKSRNETGARMTLLPRKQLPRMIIFRNFQN